MIDEKDNLVEVKNNSALVAKDEKETKLVQDTQNIVQNIIDENNIDNLKDLTKLFNVMIAKKNAIRMMQLNDLLDAVNEEAMHRITENPTMIKDKDLSVYMSQIQNQLDRASKSFEALDVSPTIQLNQQNNNVNINLTSDSKERILEVIKMLTQQQDESTTSEDAVDTTYSELFDDEEDEEN